MIPAALRRFRHLRPVRPRRRIAIQVGLASAIAVFIVLPIQASAAGNFEYDTYSTSAYERQVDKHLSHHQ